MRMIRVANSKSYRYIIHVVIRVYLHFHLDLSVELIILAGKRSKTKAKRNKPPQPHHQKQYRKLVRPVLDDSDTGDRDASQDNGSSRIDELEETPLDEGWRWRY